MEEKNEEKASFGLKLLSFLIPIAGLILFACNLKEKPKYAKGCGIAALSGFIITILISFLIPIILGLVIFTNNQKAIEKSSLSDEKINAYNSLFEDYKGENVKGTTVKALIQSVKIRNTIEDSKRVTIKVDGITANSTASNITVTPSKYYTITMEYDIEGYIDQINVTTNL